MPKLTIGWDVGGAHLKAALLNQSGQVQHIIQVPCALWRGLAELESAIDVVLNQFSIHDAGHAITMSGELVDLFQNRKEGVVEICQLMERRLIGEKSYYTGALQADYSGFVSASQVAQHWRAIASANWLASAAYTGRQLHAMNSSPHALLVDVGSTTTDFIVLKHYQPHCTGLTDATRMQTGELVYTGVIRTPLMAVCSYIEFEGQVTSIAAEHFATTADVYRLTAELSAEEDMADTADGKEKTIEASARRIARMIGRDADEYPTAAWVALARTFRQHQLDRLQITIQKHTEALPPLTTLTLIGAGVGRFLIKALAEQMQLPYIDVADLVVGAPNSAMLNAMQTPSQWTSSCLPAVAVASLLCDHCAF